MAEDPMKLILNLEILVGLGRFLSLLAMYCRIASSVTLPLLAAKYRCPQISAPKLPTQVHELHQQLVTNLALEILHHFSHRQIRRHRHKQMDMIFPNVATLYLHMDLLPQGFG
jgi:hypothetical protein